MITSGGLGPTADDLTAEVVADFAGRQLAFDPALDERVWARVMSVRSRLAAASEEALREGARKQAFVPDGAVVLEPIGTAPGLLVPVAGGPLIVVLPGPPSELQEMWAAAVRDVAPARAARVGAATSSSACCASTGCRSRRSPRRCASSSPPDRWRSRPACAAASSRSPRSSARMAAEAYAAFAADVARRHADTLFSPGGETVDELVAARLVSGGLTVATAESCTGGLMAGRLTDLAGSSAYVLGGLVVYANEAKTALAGVPEELIAAHGAVSPEVARALAAGASAALETDVGIGITGIAGPGGGTPEKPVGTVCLCVSTASDLRERTVHLPGNRTNVRERTTTVAMHMLLDLLG